MRLRCPGCGARRIPGRAPVRRRWREPPSPRWAATRAGFETAAARRRRRSPPNRSRSPPRSPRWQPAVRPERQRQSNAVCPTPAPLETSIPARCHGHDPRPPVRRWRSAPPGRAPRRLPRLARARAARCRPTAAVSKIPTTPAGSAAPEASSFPAPKAIGQAAPAGNMPVRGTRMTDAPRAALFRRRAGRNARARRVADAHPFAAPEDRRREAQDDGRQVHRNVGGPGGRIDEGGPRQARAEDGRSRPATPP